VRLPHPFYKFPFAFDVQRLQSEVAAFPEDCWREHPEGFKGNSALLLITTSGTQNDDLEPPMQATYQLRRCPYIMQVLAHFKTLLGRARLMRLEPGAGVPPHSDIHYYWRSRTRVHIPVVTHRDIRFHCGDQSVHMAAGEAWTFDNYRSHKVVNETPTRRIHLTFDTYGSTEFWTMAKPFGDENISHQVPFLADARPKLGFETYIGPPVMAPSELELELSRLADDIAACPDNDPAASARVNAMFVALCNDWRIVWHGEGPTKDGIKRFGKLLQEASTAFSLIPDGLKLASNGLTLAQTLPSTFDAMIAPGGADQNPG
jgi:hypothetical protein